MNTKILLADDEEGIRKVLGISLADSGYEVLTAEDGEQALALFRRAKPAIVMTDIKMPGMDGIELLKKIKQEDPDTEVIMITGHGDMDLAIKSLKYDAIDFVTKPINDDALEIALKRAHEKIDMRRQLREYTDNLEELVRQQSARLVEIERLAAVGQAVEGFSTALRDIAGNFNAGIRYFNEMPCFVAIHNRDLKVVATNQIYKDRLGDKIGRPSWEIYQDTADAPDANPVAQTFESGKGQRSRQVINYLDGSRFTAMVHTAPIRGSRGDLELVLEISADISEVERLQEELRTTQDRLSSLGLMVSSISHGVKGILTGLDGGVYLLVSGLSSNDSVKTKEGLDIVKQMVDRIRGLVMDILYYARERALDWKRMPVIDFGEDIVAVITPKLVNHPITFVKNFAANIGIFEVDAAVAATALVNIIENAIEACLEDRSGKSHRITFNVKGDNGHVIFEVEDTGVGMDSATRDSIFDMFYSTKGKMGTGLGLFIARNIVQQHGGTIQVASAPGQGSTFRVMMPRILPPAAKENLPIHPKGSG
jgi:signal transduction histidine kinase